MPKKYVYYMKDGTVLENLATTWKTATMTSSMYSSNATDSFANDARTIQGTVNSSTYGGRYYHSSNVVHGTSGQWLGPVDNNKTYIVTCEAINMSTKSSSSVGWYTGGTMTAIESVLRSTNKLNEWQRIAVLCKVPSSIDSRCTGLAVGDAFKYAFRDFNVFDVTDIDESLYPAIASMKAYAFRNRFSSVFVKEGDGIYRQGNYVGIDAATEDETVSGAFNKAVTPDKLKAWIEDGNSYKVKDNQGNDVLLENLAKTYLTETMTVSGNSKSAQNAAFDNMRSVWSTTHAGNYGGMYFKAADVVRNNWIKANPAGHIYILSCDIMHQSGILNTYSFFGVGGSASAQGITETPTSTNDYPPFKWRHCAIKITATGDFSIDFRVQTPTDTPFRGSFKNFALYDVTDIPEEYYPIIAAGKRPLLQGESPVQINGRVISYQKASVADVIGNTTNKNYIVDAGTLHDAINLGRAADVTTGPLGYGGWSQISFDNGSTWTNLSKDYLKSLEGDPRWRGEFSVRTNNVPSSAQYWLGFSVYGGMTDLFPKRANTLKYLVILDVRNSGSAVGSSQLYTYNKDGTINYSPWSNVASQEEYTRVWGVFAGETGRFFTSCNPRVGTNVRLDIKTWRQYEVTMLSDEAIGALAKMSVEQLDDAYYRYLIKQDAVNPWIDIIDMSDAASVTIGSGLAYKLLAISGAHTLTVDTFPEDAHGEDAYIVITTSSSGTVTVQAPLILMNPIIPNAINNCRVVFRNNEARLYVDDHASGYIVITEDGTGEGTLFYGITKPLTVGLDTEYISISDVLDGTDLFVSGIVSAINKPISIIGNGKDVTNISFLNGMIGTTQALSVGYATVKDFTIIRGLLNLNKCNLEGTIKLSGGSINVNSSSRIDADITGSKITFATGGTYSGTGSIDLQSSGRLTIIGGVLDGLTISNGKVSGYGGGFWGDNTQTTQTVMNCTITGCSASSSGGGFSYRYKDGDIINVTVTACTSSSWGGGFETSHNRSNAFVNTVSNCRITDCQANTGGGIAVYNNNTVINACEIRNCTARSYGSGITVTNGSTVSINGSLFDMCYEKSTVYIDASAKLTISGCTFYRNGIASDNGMISNQGSLTVANTTFTDNRSTTTSANGSVYFSGASGANATFTNCIFYNCYAITGNTGGAFYLAGSNVTLDKCTFEDCSPANISLYYGNNHVTLNNIVMYNGNINIIDRGPHVITISEYLEIPKTEMTGAITGATICILSGSTINMYSNTHEYPLQAGVIEAVGTFYVTDKNGTLHPYSADSKTNSKISNLGIWT